MRPAPAPPGMLIAAGVFPPIKSWRRSVQMTRRSGCRPGRGSGRNKAPPGAVSTPRRERWPMAHAAGGQGAARPGTRLGPASTLFASRVIHSRPVPSAIVVEDVDGVYCGILADRYVVATRPAEAIGALGTLVRQMVRDPAPSILSTTTVAVAARAMLQAGTDALAVVDTRWPGAGDRHRFRPDPCPSGRVVGARVMALRMSSSSSCSKAVASKGDDLATRPEVQEGSFAPVPVAWGRRWWWCRQSPEGFTEGAGNERQHPTRGNHRPSRHASQRYDLGALVAGNARRRTHH